MQWNTSQSLSYNSPRSKGGVLSAIPRPAETPSKISASVFGKLNYESWRSPVQVKSPNTPKYRPLLHSPSRSNLPLQSPVEGKSSTPNSRLNNTVSFLEPTLSGKPAQVGSEDYPSLLHT